MKESEALVADKKLAAIKSQFQVNVVPDWGFGESTEGGAWQIGSWARDELDCLHDTIQLFSKTLGGSRRITRQLGGVTVQKLDMGTHAGEALAHRVMFATNGTVSPWAIVHEFAHAWDANHGWRLSRALERYTHGFTNPLWQRITRRFRDWDAGPHGSEKVPGRYGRKPGCNAAGYFYGDKPSGSNWRFDRKEDFAEAVAMYIGWERDNALSEHAKKRIVRYQLKNGERDGFGTVDNWEDYAAYFYPDGGDYTKSRRWQFVDSLVGGKIEIR